MTKVALKLAPEVSLEILDACLDRTVLLRHTSQLVHYLSRSSSRTLLTCGNRRNPFPPQRCPVTRGVGPVAEQTPDQGPQLGLWLVQLRGCADVPGAAKRARCCTQGPLEDRWRARNVGQFDTRSRVENAGSAARTSGPLAMLGLQKTWSEACCYTSQTTCAPKLLQRNRPFAGRRNFVETGQKRADSD
jgi:hypothetical protein